MILGIPIQLIIAVAIYMVSTVLVTEILKKYLNIKPILLSWGVGLSIYAPLAIFNLIKFDFTTIAIFIVITGILNGGYSRFDTIKDAIRAIVGAKL